MTRKSPIKHHVRKYQRKTDEGKTNVKDYDRGHGNPPQKISKPKLRHSDQTTLNKYHVHLTYATIKSEHYPVMAVSYPGAIRLGMLARTHITPPMRVEVVKQ